MKRNVLAVALLTSCLAVGTSACKEQIKRTADFIPTPPERLICERTGTRPVVPPEHKIDWTKIKTVAAAKLEHDQFIKVLRTREGAVAGYIVRLEGQLFTCWNNMQWRRDFEADLKARTGQPE